MSLKSHSVDTYKQIKIFKPFWNDPINDFPLKIFSF